MNLVDNKLFLVTSNELCVMARLVKRLVNMQTTTLVLRNKTI